MSRYLPSIVQANIVFPYRDKYIRAKLSASVAAGAGKVVAHFSGCTGLEPTVGRATSIERRRPPMPELGVGSAGGHFPYARAVPGSHRAGPCDPGGAPYGRTEYGRPRRARDEIPGVGKGLRFLSCFECVLVPAVLYQVV